jgi:hypothetical protein
MRTIRWWPVMIVLAATVAARADSSTTSPTTLPAAAPMVQADLIAVDKAALGADFAKQTPDALYAAQLDIEKYFSGDSADRRAAVRSLALSGVDANVLGKLCHVRMGWQNLGIGKGGNAFLVDTTRAGHPARYFLGVPSDYDRTRPWPMVVKLMSAGELGNAKDPAAVISASHDWAVSQLTEHPDALVLVPIYDPKEGFGPSYAGMNAAMQSLWHAADVVNIDPARVYLIGQGEAASAGWNLVLCYPNYFAAFADFAGAAPADWERVRLISLFNVLPVIWHDDTDRVMPLSASTSLVFALHGKKIPVEFIKTHGIGHLPNPQTVDRVYDIMRQRTRPLYPATVELQSTRPDTLFNRADWLQAWQPMDGGDYQRVFFHGGPENMRIFSNPLTVVATCKDNRIEANLQNVESVTIFLNDQMIDFSKPLKIEVNHHLRYTGPAIPSVQRMLADHLLLGRGWRYFSAAIDIDMLPPPPSPKTRPATGPSPG